MSDAQDFIPLAYWLSETRLKSELKQAERERDEALDKLEAVLDHARFPCQEFDCKCEEEAESILKKAGRI